MATITITQFARSASDADGQRMEMGDRFIAGQTLTAAGAATALAAGCSFVRIATDTAFTSNVYGSGTSVLHPAGSVEFFPAQAAQVITFTAVT